MRRRFRCRDAFSNITSTIILTSVLLAIMIVASYLSNDVLTTQIAASEFKSAEDLTKTIDSEVRKLMFKPGSSTVIKAGFSTTAPGFTKTGKTMNITIGGNPFSVDANVFKIEGRQSITGALEYDIQGDSSVLVSPYNGSIGRIHVSKPQNWRASIDYERVLYTFTGIVNLFDGSKYTPYNTVELTCIVLTFGEFISSDNALILIQNERVEPADFTLTGNWVLTVSSPGRSGSIHLAGMGGNSVYPSRVNFYRVYMKISVLEGG